jgi:hypothetical protein
MVGRRLGQPFPLSRMDCRVLVARTADGGARLITATVADRATAAVRRALFGLVPDESSAAFWAAVNTVAATGPGRLSCQAGTRPSQDQCGMARPVGTAGSCDG